MDTKRYLLCELGDKMILLGKQGESGALRIEFDCAPWLEEYPAATIKLFVFNKAHRQDDPILPVLGSEGALRVWIVGEDETATSGHGVIELVLLDASTGSTLKSATGYTTVIKSPSAGIEAREAQAGYVRYDLDQSEILTEEQKAIARNNIGAGTGSGTGGGIAVETDPTVPAWAKAATKPTYTAAEVGALPSTYVPPNQTAAQVGADPAGTAVQAIGAHDVDDEAHEDIRALIVGLTNRLNALANSDDTTLDQMAEVVAYIKNNKTLIDGITTGKISTSDIVNNLTTNVSTKVLSAAQGVALKALIDAIVVPTTLPNPQPIVINGVSYDGSEKKEVTIQPGSSTGGAAIDDTTPSADKTYSSEKIQTELNQLSEKKITDEDGAVKRENIADLAINNAKLNYEAVSNAKIMAGTIQKDRLAADTIQYLTGGPYVSVSYDGATRADIVQGKHVFALRLIDDSSRNLRTWLLNHSTYDGVYLHQGTDIEGPIKLLGRTDFVGGIHGGEQLVSMRMIADGVDITGTATDLAGVKTLAVYVTSTVNDEDGGAVLFSREKVLTFSGTSLTVENRWVYTGAESVSVERWPGCGLYSAFTANTLGYTTNTMLTPTMDALEADPEIKEASFWVSGTCVTLQALRGIGNKYAGLVEALDGAARIKIYLDAIHAPEGYALNMGDVLEAAYRITIGERNVATEAGKAGAAEGKLIDYMSSTGSSVSGAPNYFTFNYTDGSHDRITVYNGEKGEPGDDYVLTDADKQEIAGMIPGGGGSVSLDTTLTEYGKAADAGAVGNAIDQAVSELKEANVKQDTRLSTLESATVPEGNDLNLFYGALIRRKANRNEPVNIEMTYAGGQNQPTHPSVLFIADGWNGHKWWMAYSPYPYSNDDYENPCIAYSDDGLNWIEDGISNPIEPMPSSGYNSDPDILIVDGVMECWWRQVDGSGHEIIKRRKSSDGFAWGTSETLHTTTTTNAGNCLSPSVLYEEGKYKIWAMRQRTYVDYYESADGTNWQKIREIADLSPLEDYKIWHLDVIKTNLGYELAASYQYGDNFDTNHYIAWAYSADNIDYTDPVCVLGRGNSGNFDSLELYRPSLVKVGRKYRMYYGAQKSGRIWSIGVVETPDMLLLNELLAQTDSSIPVYTPEAVEIPCTGISLDQTALTFDGAGTQTLTETVTPDDTTDTVVWSSDDASVASVVGGVVTAKANGAATITATCGAYSATCTVSVSGIDENGDASELPEGYTLLKSAVFDGNQYLNTNVTATARTGAEFKVKPYSLPQYGVHILSDKNNYFFASIRNQDKKIFVKRGGNELLLGGTYSANRLYDISAFVDGDAYTVNGEANSLTDNGVACDGTLYLGAYPGDLKTHALVGELYYMRIYEGTALVRNYVPCKNSTGEIGLYDLVNGTFNLAQGTGSFGELPDLTGGATPDSEIPDGYTAYTVDGTQDYALYEPLDDVTKFEFTFPSDYSTSGIIGPSGFVFGNGALVDNNNYSRYPAYDAHFYSQKNWMVITLSADDVGTTKESVQAWLAQNNIVFYLKNA